MNDEPNVCFTFTFAVDVSVAIGQREAQDFNRIFLKRKTVATTAHSCWRAYRSQRTRENLNFRSTSCSGKNNYHFVSLMARCVWLSIEIHITSRKRSFSLFAESNIEYSNEPCIAAMQQTTNVETSTNEIRGKKRKKNAAIIWHVKTVKQT